MSAWRWIVAGVVITALTVAIGFVLFDDEAVPGPGTVAAPTTRPATTTTSTVAPSTTPTTAQPSDVPSTMATRDRVGEVESLVKDLYLRRYQAIYNRDTDSLIDIVATQRSYDAALKAMEQPRYPQAPTEAALDVDVVDLLLDAPNCLVVFLSIDASRFQGNGATSEVVEVLWPHDGGWRLATKWRYPDDLWETDCDPATRIEL